MKSIKELKQGRRRVRHVPASEGLAHQNIAELVVNARDRLVKNEGREPTSCKGNGCQQPRTEANAESSGLNHRRLTQALCTLKRVTPSAEAGLPHTSRVLCGRVGSGQGEHHAHLFTSMPCIATQSPLRLLLPWRDENEPASVASVKLVLPPCRSKTGSDKSAIV